MKALLMFERDDFHPDPVLMEAIDHPYRRNRQPEPTAAEPVGQMDMISDLELERLWDAMANGDAVVYVSVRTAMLDPLQSIPAIRYRQAVLGDCLAQPAVVREIYALALQAIAEERKAWSITSWSNHGEALLRRCVSVIEALVPILKRLRAVAEKDGGQFASRGFKRFFQTLCNQLDDAYFEEIEQHLGQLRFRHGVMISARLGEASQGVDYVLRAARPENAGRFRLRHAQLAKPTYSYTVPARDEAGGQALGRLRDRGLDLVANALGQSTDHIVAFFKALRGELGFYVGCLNLREQLSANGEPTCLPDPQERGTLLRCARGLYDPCLSLQVGGCVTGNELAGDGKPLIVVTGANQGGKSTFLRSLGVAQLMLQAGMFTAAESFTASVATGVFTHYKREEDATMRSGKFDEELARMAQIAGALDNGCLLLCNESFAATNEREGSDIAYEFLEAMRAIGVTVVFVTHLYDLAHRYQQNHPATTLFLRAGRAADGRRSYRLAQAPPLPTSYGQDLYRRTFPDDEPARGGALAASR